MLVYRRITEEVYEDGSIKEITSNDDEIKILKQRIDFLQEQIELLQKPSDDVDEPNTLPVVRREVANCNQKPYKRLSYSNFEFESIGRYNGKVLFDISDIVKLSKKINNFEDYPTMTTLKKVVLPNAANNTFAKVVWNYQEGYFKEYLSDYHNNTEFTICNNHVCINGIDTKLRPNEVYEIVNILSNATDRDSCVDNLIKQYNKTKPLFVKIICDFSNQSQISEVMEIPKQEFKIENNPQKRRESYL